MFAPFAPITTVQFHPADGTLAVMVELPNGHGQLLATTEEHLLTHMRGSGDDWGNDQLLLATQELLDAHPEHGGRGYIVVMASRRPALTPAVAPRLLPDTTLRPQSHGD